MDIEGVQHRQEYRPQYHGSRNDIHEHADDQQQDVDRKQEHPGGLNVLDHGIGDLTGDLLEGQVLAEHLSAGDDDQQAGADADPRARALRQRQRQPLALLLLLGLDIFLDHCLFLLLGRFLAF